MFETLYTIFIRDGAWLTILKGLLATVQISALSLLFGTLLGAVICGLRLSNFKPAELFAKIYVEIIRGSPVLMLLMLLFYGVFARTDFSPLAIAVITFSLHTAAYVAELLRSTFGTIDKGQVEAARTLGFSKWQAFRLIALPQIIHVAKPVYQSITINLIQWTSVVGYVSITDLTRVINNTAARTMQPMITIIGGIILYLALSNLVNSIFSWSDKKDSGGEAKTDERH